MDQLVSVRLPSEDLSRSLTITAVRTTIVDLPIRRAHQFAATRITTQAYLLVEIETRDGPTGLGEGATPGGPWWSGDSIETMKQMIDVYLAPAIVGHNALDIVELHNRMNKVVFGNRFAKAAIDVALWDVLGKTLDAPIHALFGGRIRDKSEISWALATGDTAGDIAEAESMLDRKLARVFKIKGGAKSPEDDVKHSCAVVKALSGKADIRLDINQVWDEMTANRWIPALADAGISLIEQPVQHWNVDALARIRHRYGIRVMADESVCTLQDAIHVVQKAAVDVIAYKVMKCGGLTACRQIAGIAEAAGIACFGGTFLDSSIGAAAGLHVGASERSVTFGSEFIGGLWLAEEVVEERLVYRDFHVEIPTRPGNGMSLDRAKVERFRRA